MSTVVHKMHFIIISRCITHHCNRLVIPLSNTKQLLNCLVSNMNYYWISKHLYWTRQQTESNTLCRGPSYQGCFTNSSETVTSLRRLRRTKCCLKYGSTESRLSDYNYWTYTMGKLCIYITTRVLNIYLKCSQRRSVDGDSPRPSRARDHS